MTILSRRPMTEKEILTVEDVLSVAQCPHEVLKKIFPNYVGLTADFIFFGSDEPELDFYRYDLEVSL